MAEVTVDDLPRDGEVSETPYVYPADQDVQWTNTDPANFPVVAMLSQDNMFDTTDFRARNVSSAVKILLRMYKADGIAGGSILVSGLIFQFSYKPDKKDPDHPTFSEFLHRTAFDIRNYTL